jgi:hypothetical protein
LENRRRGQTGSDGGAPAFQQRRKKMILWVDLVVKRKKTRGYVNIKFPAVLGLK